MIAECQMLHSDNAPLQQAAMGFMTLPGLPP